MTTDGEQYAQRLYGRVPAHYRAYDAERGEPLRALLRLVGAQAADLHADMDALWDNFFIETCDDWAVPYIGALVGANLLARPVEGSNRLDVRNAVAWRRRKGTPEMLRQLAAAVSGWPADLAEFFRGIGWSQNVNHTRPEAVLTVDLRDLPRLSRLGRADDPWAHAADVRTPGALDQPRVTAAGAGQSAWGTPGRYQIKQLGFFVSRLRTYAICGATPAPAAESACEEAPRLYTFDPLHTSAPLFEQAGRTPITRVAFLAEPWKTFGTDIAVRQYGILLAADPRVRPKKDVGDTAPGHPPGAPAASRRPAAGFDVLHTAAGLSLPDQSRLKAGVAVEFEAMLLTDAAAADPCHPTPAAGRGRPHFRRLGRLRADFTFELTPPDAPDPRGLPAIRVSAPTEGVPATELVVTNREEKSLLVYLPAIAPGAAGAHVYMVADDGSTHPAPTKAAGLDDLLADHSFAGLPVARESVGQVLPIPKVWPLRHRHPVAVDLSDGKPLKLPPGDLGIDPELGRFAVVLGKDEPAEFRVDYVEAFSADVGARPFARDPDPAFEKATRRTVRYGQHLPEQKIYPDVRAALDAVTGPDELIEIADSATYLSDREIEVRAPGVRELAIRAAPGQRPCLIFRAGDGLPTAASFRIKSRLDRFDLAGLLVSGGPVRIDPAPGRAAGSLVGQLTVDACTFDPRAAVTRLDRASFILPGGWDVCLSRCVSGAVRMRGAGGRVVVVDSVIDPRNGPAAVGAPDVWAVFAPRAAVQLERVTVLGRVRCRELAASETLFDGEATAADRQAGCVRFTRYELGSVLPRRYLCVPAEDQARAANGGRVLAPVFNSRRFGRPDYAQLAAGCPRKILEAGEDGGEVGAFAGAFAGRRLANLLTKLQEFMPAGLTAAVLAET